jgi:hypothetical protein
MTKEIATTSASQYPIASALVNITLADHMPKYIRNNDATQTYGLNNPSLKFHKLLSTIITCNNALKL